jgi:hypothetical protein
VAVKIWSNTRVRHDSASPPEATRQADHAAPIVRQQLLSSADSSKEARDDGDGGQQPEDWARGVDEDTSVIVGVFELLSERGERGRGPGRDCRRHDSRRRPECPVWRGKIRGRVEDDGGPYMSSSLGAELRPGSGTSRSVSGFLLIPRSALDLRIAESVETGQVVDESGQWSRRWMSVFGQNRKR